MNTAAQSISQSRNQVFNPKLVLALVLVSIFSFGAYFTLAGFSENLRSDRSGRAHALSKSPNGFAGIYKLLGDHAVDVYGKRTDLDGEDSYSLTIYTLPRPSNADMIDKLDLDYPTLIVAPKWQTRADWREKGRTIKVGPHSTQRLERTLEGLDEDIEIIRDYDIRSHEITAHDLNVFEEKSLNAQSTYNITIIDSLQTFRSEIFLPVLTSGDDMVLGVLEGTDTYLLSDPDLFNNAGLISLETAKLGVSIVKYINYEDDPVYFDLTQHGLGSDQNLIKIMLTPPFLAATLCLLAVGGLIGWRAFTRFGAPHVQKRAYALGKQALADNSADLIRSAGREPFMAKRYAELIKQRTAKSIRLPKTLNAKDTQDTLDRLSKRSKTQSSFSLLFRRASTVSDNTALMKTAKDLHNWKQEITHERD